MTPRTSFRWTPEIIQECALMWKNDKSYLDIANEYGITRNMVSGMVSRNRDLFPGKEGARRGSYVDKIDIKKASSLWNKGLKREEIAAMMGVGVNAIRLLSERNREIFPKKKPGGTGEKVKVVRPKGQKAITVSDNGRLHAQFNGTKRAEYFDPGLDEYEISKLPGVPLVENDGCMYPLTEGPNNHMFCGHNRRLGSRYCQYHAHKTKGYMGIDISYRDMYDKNVIREGRQHV